MAKLFNADSPDTAKTKTRRNRDCPEIKRHIKQNADSNFKTGGYGKLGINQLCHRKSLNEIETNISNMKTKLDDIETRYYKSSAHWIRHWRN